MRVLFQKIKGKKQKINIYIFFELLFNKEKKTDTILFNN